MASSRGSHHNEIFNGALCVQTCLVRLLPFAPETVNRFQKVFGGMACPHDLTNFTMSSVTGWASHESAVDVEPHASASSYQGRFGDRTRSRRSIPIRDPSEGS